MNILYFTQLFYPAVFGGGEYIFYNWALELARSGHQVFVVTQKLRGEKNFEVLDGISIHRVGLPIDYLGTLPSGILQNASFLLNSYFKGLEILKKNKIDLIHSNTYVPVISANWCAKKKNIPHIITVHDVYHSSDKDFWKNWSKQKGTPFVTRYIGRWLEKTISQIQANAFHTVSNKSKSDLEQIGVSRPITVIPNGIRADRYKAQGKTEKQIIYVGRLVFYKNLDTLIDAFSMVVKKVSNTRLIIVGDGPMRTHMENKIHGLGLENNVILKGRVSEEEKIMLIGQSTALANPSTVEGFGIVVLEGFACSKPAIVSDVEPLSDLVIDNEDGFVVPAFDAAAWSEKMLYFLENEQAAVSMGSKGRQKVEEQYSVEKLSKSLLQLYNSVLR